jgi:DNA (cytosine-5)-methyltransferase 1
VNPFDGRENAYLRLINDDRAVSLVFNHKARYCSPINHEINRRLNPGDDATDPKIADIMPYAHRNDKFKDKYFKLHADRPCRTITLIYVRIVIRIYIQQRRELNAKGSRQGTVFSR